MKKQIDNTFTELPKTLLNLVSKIKVDDKEYNNIKEWYNSLSKKEGNFVVVLNPSIKKIKVEKVKEIRGFV